MPLEVDWTRSVLSEPGIAAEQLVPGTSSAVSVMVNIPPTVIPGAGFADVRLFRRGALPADEVPRAGCFTAAYGSATVTLSVNGEWWAQSLTGLEAIGREVRAREAAEAAAKAAAAARFAQQQRQRALTACEQRADHQDRLGRHWMFLGGIGLVAGASLTAGGGIAAGLTPYQETEDSAVGVMSLGLLGLVGGVTADLIGWKQHHDARNIERECGINPER